MSKKFVFLTSAISLFFDKDVLYFRFYVVYD